MVALLLCIANVNQESAKKSEHWFAIFSAVMVMPACFANMINGFALMVEGRVKLRWKCWMQLIALFAISFPIVGYFFWAYCQRQLSSIGAVDIHSQ